MAHLPDELYSELRTLQRIIEELEITEDSYDEFCCLISRQNELEYLLNEDNTKECLELPF